MPLSEHEQRILDQIERGLYHDDPRRARRLSATTLPRYLRRRSRWAALGFVVGLAVLVAAVATNWVVGLIGFVLMTASAVVAVSTLRRRGRIGLDSLSARLGGADGLAQRWREGTGRFLGRPGSGRPD